MPVNSPSRREYVQFKRMLEQALLEVPLPAGIIDTDHIVPGAIRPENCKLDAQWEFQSNNFQRAPRPLASTTTTTASQEPNKISVDSYGGTSSYSVENEPVEEEEPESVEKVVFLDAVRRKVIFTLPSAAKNSGVRVYVKRTDSDTNQICRIETFQDDKIDEDDRITLAALEAVILIADSGKWHLLSRYTPS